MRMAVQDKLETGVNLKKREWKGSQKCCLCGLDETTDHFFFQCHIARSIWYCFKEALGWDRCPTGMQDIFYHWIVLGGKDYYVKLVIFTIILWGLWNVRKNEGGWRCSGGELMTWKSKACGEEAWQVRVRPEDQLLKHRVVLSRMQLDVPFSFQFSCCPDCSPFLLLCLLYLQLVV
jgi:hypothetical protein